MITMNIEENKKKLKILRDRDYGLSQQVMQQG